MPEKPEVITGVKNLKILLVKKLMELKLEENL